MTTDLPTPPESNPDTRGDGGDADSAPESPAESARAPRASSGARPAAGAKRPAASAKRTPRSASGTAASPRKPSAAGRPAAPRKAAAPRKPPASRVETAPEATASAPAIAQPHAVAEIDDIVVPPRPPLPVVESGPVEPEPVDAEPELEQEPEVVVPPEVEVVAAAAEAVAETHPVETPAPAESLFVPTESDPSAPALEVVGVAKRFGETLAVESLHLSVPAGTFYGIVGPNGAGKTTTLSMIAGLLRPDSGDIRVNGLDARTHEREVKRLIGVLPDRLRTFDRLSGRQLLYYCGVLRGLDPAVVERRSADLARALDLVDALARPVSDYSAGMTKKVMLAGALIHSPRLLVLDEPFESVDPVSSAVILDILSAYVAGGGTVVLSSHGIDLVERVCSRVAILVGGQVVAEGSVPDVRGQGTLESRFIELTGGTGDAEGLEWLHAFSG